MNNLDLMRKRLEWQGGIPQENRMIKDKFRAFQRALLYSYQACTVSLVQPYEYVMDSHDSGFYQDFQTRALINPDKVKQDYDDKIISVPYESGFRPGDVFEWKKTDTYWIIYLEQITEDAYFRGEIRRCRYTINFVDENGDEWWTYAAIRGPVETKIDSIQKNQVRIDRPNLSLNILIPKNEKTLKAFDRYSEFLFDGKCWRVEAPDTISMKNVIELAAEEHFVDKDTDDWENNIKNRFVPKKIDVTPNSGIEGPAFIKPKIPEEYSVDEAGGIWSIVENFPVCIIKNSDATKIQVTWKKSVSGQFTLQWKKDDITLTKVIVVESLF